MQYLVIRIINLIGKETQRVVHIDYFCQTKHTEDKTSERIEDYPEAIQKTKNFNSGGSRIFLGAPTPKVGVLTFYFENCMKMKEFGLLMGALVHGAPLGFDASIPLTEQ